MNKFCYWVFGRINDGTSQAFNEFKHVDEGGFLILFCTPWGDGIRIYKYLSGRMLMVSGLQCKIDLVYGFTIEYNGLDEVLIYWGL